ncbi:hypothetical protein EMPS_03994 [Entomortierella parvispora]|uniref:Uncharacterized protein n=1 Tax=Entomortierella parvispora TaxID=205924 RepID=A0A9P3H7T1_9FUNG|nr:hypothetical protein EMPS_03994 [Entomortierella parvispora]
MATSGGWNDGINERRKGAGYFLSQGGDLSFKPGDYIHHRALPRDQSAVLIHEWARWMSDLKQSSHEVARRTAVAASALTQDDIDEYYRVRVTVGREQDALESSKIQLHVTDQQLTTRLEKRQAEASASSKDGLGSMNCTAYPSVGGKRQKVSGEDAEDQPSSFGTRSANKPLSLKRPAPKTPEKVPEKMPSEKSSPEKPEALTSPQRQEEYLAALKRLNQKVEWKCGDLDFLARFDAFKTKPQSQFSLALDDVADITTGSDFTKEMSRDLRKLANACPASDPNVEEQWPTLIPILARLRFPSDPDPSDSYRSVVAALRKEDHSDPIVAYLESVVYN